MGIRNIDVLKPPTEDVHMLDCKDGYPICWPVAEVDYFVGSYNDHQITCPECLEIMREEAPHAS